MRNVLIVANQTVGGDALTRAVQRRIDAGACTFRLAVPLPRGESNVVVSVSVASERAEIEPPKRSPERNLAEQRVAYGVDWLRQFDPDADGEVVGSNPVDDIDHLVRVHDIDEVIVSTLPSTISKWLRQDLPSKVARKVKVPVEVVTAEP